MKWKCVAIFAVLAMLFATANSQNESVLYGDNSVVFNGRVSPNFSWLIVPEKGNFSTAKAGVNVSFTADFRVASNVFIAVGGQYSYLMMGLYKDLEYKHQGVGVSYLGIPLTLKVKTSCEHRHKFYGELGFDMGVKLSSDERISRMKAGGVIGAGYEYYLTSNVGLQFGVLYHAGFTNIFKKDNVGVTIGYPQSFDIVVGVLF